ncbi:MAG: hypothetical protein V1793_24465 [Pseudomonadota bacterium]
MKTFKTVLAVLAVLLVSGCSSLPLQRARTAFYAGNLESADQVLKNCNDVSGKDRLLCHMEKGLILFYLKDYETSTRALLNAENLMKTQDQISVADQSSAVLVNDSVTAYKGEYSERLWVHTFLMMNFLLQNRIESALVEAKQALEVIDKYPKALAGDHFTRALIGLCFENMNLFDDARIEYEKLSGEAGTNLFLPGTLPRDRGELVLFVAQGHIPVKVSADIILPPSIRISVPRYMGQSPPALPMTIRSRQADLSPEILSTDMGEVAKKSLDERSAEIFSRQAIRAGAKEAIAREAGKRSDVAEGVARIILFLLEQADTRSWETLPGRLSLVRVQLEPGLHDLEISTGYSQPIRLNTLEIPAGARAYQSVRF